MLSITSHQVLPNRTKRYLEVIDVKIDSPLPPPLHRLLPPFSYLFDSLLNLSLMYHFLNIWEDHPASLWVNLD